MYDNDSDMVGQFLIYKVAMFSKYWMEWLLTGTKISIDAGEDQDRTDLAEIYKWSAEII